MSEGQAERNPFVGPRPFEPRQVDRARFFGRDEEVREIVSLILSQPLLLVYALSGAGKTSLFNARIIPELEGEDFEVFPVIRVGSALPEGMTAEEDLNVFLFNTLLSLDPGGEPDELAKASSEQLQGSLAKFLEERPRKKNARGKPAPRVVIFDQFEELFTLYRERWKQRARVFEEINAALEADPLLRVVIIMREDFVAQLEPYADLFPEGFRSRYRIERLRDDAALQAVEGPLEATYRSFEAGVAERTGRGSAQGARGDDCGAERRGGWRTRGTGAASGRRADALGGTSRRNLGDR